MIQFVKYETEKDKSKVMRESVLSRKLMFFITLMFELLLLYLLISSFVRDGIPEHTFWWVAFIIKIGLGYATYRLYISKNLRLIIIGIILTIIVIVFLFIMYYTSREYISPVVGGFSPFILTANTFFLFKYWRNPEKQFKTGDDTNKLTLVFCLLFCLLFAIRPHVVVYWTFMISWISIQCFALGIIPLKKDHRNNPRS